MLGTLLNILYAIVALGVFGLLLGLLLSFAEEGTEEKKYLVTLEKENPDHLNYKHGTLKEGDYPQVHCRGGKEAARQAFTYRGLEDCTALYLLFKGNKVCKFGCLEMGSCIRICPTGAIEKDPHGTVWVDPNVCVSCGMCVSVCPTGVLRWIPRGADYYVACNSSDDGPSTLEACSVGCTGCRICERRSPDGGFSVERNLARIVYSRKGERMYAAQDCPTKCIVSLNTTQ